jgi:hypothetical protein
LIIAAIWNQTDIAAGGLHFGFLTPADAALRKKSGKRREAETARMSISGSSLASEFA